MPPDFFGFLLRSLEEIGASEPEADLALALSLGPLRARITANGESFILARDAARWRIEASSQADVHVSFDSHAVSDLIAGAVTLNEAILEERIAIVGPVDKVARFHDALVIYLEGLLRAPGTAQLLEQYVKG
jgi:hypothetical protein